MFQSLQNLKFSVFVFLVLEYLFYCNLFATASDMAQIHSPKSSFARHTVNFVFLASGLYVGIACVAYFTLVPEMSLISKHRGLISLCFYYFVKHEGSIGVYLERFLTDALFLLHFGVDLKVLVSLGLLFYL